MKLIAPFLFAALSTVASSTIKYKLTPEPDRKTVLVEITVEKAGEKPVFQLPTWCPGFYFLIKYEDKVSDFAATAADGSKLSFEKGKSEWTVKNPGKGAVTVKYRVKGDDAGLGFFGTNVRDDKAFVNGPSAFMYVAGRKEEKTELQVSLPKGWDIATGSESKDGVYTASGYDELADHPIQMGAFERRQFKVEGIPFEAIWVATNNTFNPDLDAETEILRKVSIPAIKLFGSAPFKHYTYIFHLAIGNFGGGLEHRASTVIAIPNSRQLGLDDLAAHEYFHAWNVKQIRPANLGPFDYMNITRTANLWFSEGVTDYYAKMTTYRSGCQEKAWLFRELSGQVQEIQGARGRLGITLADVSRRAWENGGFGVNGVSYYTKGLLVGWIFDAVIRSETKGKKSLDDVMRLLYKKYALPKPGFAEDGLMLAISEVAGKDLSALYQRMVNSTQELPYDLLNWIGLNVDANGNVGELGRPTDEQRARLAEWLSR
ncbi:MAG: M61 family metallopeptidase [Armatimonadetes bacterium]|nr:M61 family metallopeptidase [Armatimonadota bacterium]